MIAGVYFDRFLGKAGNSSSLEQALIRRRQHHTDCTRCSHTHLDATTLHSTVMPALNLTPMAYCNNTLQQDTANQNYMVV